MGDNPQLSSSHEESALVKVLILRTGESSDLALPAYATAGSAGLDLRACISQSITLPPGGRALVGTGIAVALPAGAEAQIRPRSGTSFKKGLQIPNAPGTIDSDYPDEWMVIVRNPAATAIRIEHGERIAQMVLARYEVLAIESGDVAVTTSRVGGFGSTGH